MSDFTYKLPDFRAYGAAIVAMAKREAPNIHEVIKHASIEVSTSESFSRRRWNAFSAYVVFRLPLKLYQDINMSREDENGLLTIANKAMTQEAGFDVMSIDFAPSLESTSGVNSLEADLEEISSGLRAVQAQFELPSDIIENGQRTSEAYLYLYAVENYMRLFIETVKSSNSKDFKISLPIQKSIESRKLEESKNQWMSLRGNSELFYLDFKDLGTLIVNNWEIFKLYFPDQGWIKSKLDELGNCRNLVAHNSVLGEHERDVIRTDFRSIVNQLNPHIVGST